MNKKCFIAIDGLDGSGKQTQSVLLCEWLEKMGRDYRYLTFPTYDSENSALVSRYLRGDFGDDPDAVNPYIASSFFAVDRVSSFLLDWKKDYDADRIIVANRYTTANAVHQLSKLPEEEWDGFLEWLFNYEFELLGLPVPTTVIYLCLDPAVSDRLIENRCLISGASKDIHEKSKAHLQKSYKAARYAAEKLGWITVECAENGVMRSIDDIQNELKGILKEKYEL